MSADDEKEMPPESDDAKPPAEAETDAPDAASGPVVVADEVDDAEDVVLDETGMDDTESEEPVEPLPDAAEIDTMPDDIASSPRRAARGGTSVIAILVAAIIGGGVALGGLVFAERMGLVGGSNDDAQVALEDGIVALGADLTDLQARLEAQGGRIDGLSARQTDMETAFAPTDALAAEADRLSALAGQLESFDQRLTDLENRPLPEAGASAEAVQAYEQQLAAMRAMLADELVRIEDQQAQAQAARSDAALSAAFAERSRALGRLRAMIDSGGDFGDQLQVLAGLGLTIPQSLADLSGGVPTLGALQDSFAEPARAAVAADIRARAASGDINRFEAFLRNQLGLRSVDPREGDDAEAILARAEDALGRGETGVALAELDALSPDARIADLQDWIARAADRQAALDGVAALEVEIESRGAE